MTATAFAMALLWAAQEPPASPAAAEPAASDVPSIAFEKSALPNGLEVLIHQDARLPVVCVSVWYRVGAFQEETGKSGFARLFERLLASDTHAQQVEDAGGSSFTATSDFDRTSFAQCVPKNEAELALWLESDRMAYRAQTIDAKKLEEQRAAVKSERRARVDEAPWGLAEEQLWQAMFPPEHPYRGRVTGTLADLDRASIDDVKRFYDNYYAASNATVAVVGDLEPAAAKKLVEKYFRTLPEWRKPAARQVTAPSFSSEIRLDLVDERAPLAKVVVRFFTPAAFQPGNAEVDVLAYVLGHGNGGRLYQGLVVDAPLAQEVSATQSNHQNVSVLTLSAVVRPGVNPEDVLNGMQAQLDFIKDIPPGPEEIARAVANMEAAAVFSMREPLGRAEHLQRYNMFAGDPGFLPKDLARYRAVTPETLQAAVTTMFPKEKRAVLVVTPKEAP